MRCCVFARFRAVSVPCSISAMARAYFIRWAGMRLAAVRAGCMCQAEAVHQVLLLGPGTQPPASFALLDMPLVAGR